MKFADVSMLQFSKEAQMYRIISQYSKYFSVNSLNHPLKINVRLKRMFNMLLFEYFEIMVGNIYQMYYMKSHW